MFNDLMRNSSQVDRCACQGSAKDTAAKCSADYGTAGSWLFLKETESSRTATLLPALCPEGSQGPPYNKGI